MHRHVSTIFVIACSLFILAGCPQPATTEVAKAKEEAAKPSEPPAVTVKIDPVLEPLKVSVEEPVQVVTKAETKAGTTTGAPVDETEEQPVVIQKVEVTPETVVVEEKAPNLATRKNALPNYLVFKTGTPLDLSVYELSGDEVLLRCSYSNKAIADRDMLVTAKYFEWLKSDDVSFEKDGILRAKVGSASCRVVSSL